MHTIDCLNYLNWVVLVLQKAVYIFSESGLSLIEKYYTKYLVFQQFSSNLYKSESRKNEFWLYCHRWCEKKVFPINNRYFVRGWLFSSENDDYAWQLSREKLEDFFIVCCCVVIIVNFLSIFSFNSIILRYQMLLLYKN